MTMNVTVRNDCVCFGDRLEVRFERTLRIPDDGRSYPLPPSFGAFPVKRIDDYLDRVPAEWREHGGVFLPMYQREAMWLSFRARKPTALKVGVGKVCAITGKRFDDGLGSDPQDYVVAPHQPWLDGICVKKGTIRQFVAMPLGLGATVEGQVTGEETHGGVQLIAFGPKAGRIPDPPVLARAFGGGFPPGAPPFAMPAACASAAAPAPAARPRSAAHSSAAMGLAAGGRMKQSIYADPHGTDVWDRGERGRCFVHLVNSAMWREITGESAPETPITAREYERSGMPWYSIYDEGVPSLEGSSVLAKVKSVAEIDSEASTVPQQDDTSVEAGPVHSLWHRMKAAVRDGAW